MVNIQCWVTRKLYIASICLQARVCLSKRLLKRYAKLLVSFPLDENIFKKNYFKIKLWRVFMSS